MFGYKPISVVKVWDLTAGKLLHDFKFHEGHIRTIEFHPVEFLLATGISMLCFLLMPMVCFMLHGLIGRVM